MSGTAATYLFSCGGLLKIVQLTCSLTTLYQIATLTFDRKHQVFRMEQGDLSVTVTVFAFATSSCILTISILNGSSDVPETQLYRMNYAIGALVLSVNTGFYAARVWDMLLSSPKQGVAVYLCAANAVAHLINYMYAVRARTRASITN